MIAFPNAKINLGLNIINKRADGFHNIESCFYPIQWTDVLEISRAEKTEIINYGIPVPGTTEENLCYKVWKKLETDFGIPPVQLHLYKNIPIGAGLGGGSSDAAFCCKLLNEYFQLGMSAEEMENLVRPLGSDCAFFIKNKPVIAIEKGDVFEEIDFSLAGYWMLLVFPEIHINTKEAYSGVKPGESTVELKDLLKKDMTEWKMLVKNDFEPHLFSKYPVLKTVKNNLYQLGAIYASMTGSGSCIYGIFKNEPESGFFAEKTSFKVQNLLLKV